MKNNKQIKKVAILGAGVMGAQIAAHFANANIPVVLFDLPAKGNDKNAIIKGALKLLGKLKPAPLGYKSVIKLIEPANYDDDLNKLSNVDLIIEAVAERMDIKKSLYDKIEDYIKADTIFATNTSGLSINDLSQVFPEHLKHQFCGVHFFNPPRYMHLVEIIATEKTNRNVIDNLTEFLTSTLGKGVVNAKDTPNFIANRIGVFSIICTIYHGMKFNIPLETVDALTGTLIGRAKSATFRTADVVGLDTLNHTVNTMKNHLPDDPWNKYYQLPKWLQGLIEAGALGQKTKAGVYKKEGREIKILDINNKKYRVQNVEIEPAVLQILKNRNANERFAQLRALKDSNQAQFLWSMYRDLFHYTAYHLEDIADNTRDIDFAIRWGFGWQQGPFEIWQSAGWAQIAQWINEDMKDGETMIQKALPNWAAKIDAAHTQTGSYAPKAGSYQPRADLAVFNRQLFAETTIGEKTSYGTTVFADDDIRLWHMDDEILITSFKTKKHIITEGVLAGIMHAVDIAEADYKGMVIWQTNEPFTLGANLAPALQAVAAGKVDLVEKLVNTFQQTSQKLRFSQVPTIVATSGLTLGGGCEFSMNATSVVAAFESYIGLVEAGVGLLPAGGGLKEIARRASEQHETGDLYPQIEHMFKLVAMAQVAGSALEAKNWGLLKPCTDIVFNTREVLHVAKAKVNWLHAKGYQTPVEEQNIRVVGNAGIANMKMILANMMAGRMMSEHDYEIAVRIATVISGGDIDSNSLVNEQYLLDLERKLFIELIQMPKTLARIEHTLKTGKPLRN
ncbi:3-hydroxyacyl-CoA dehydrogenase [fadN-fadA-fadE operon] / Enoyl-CoA hydratase [fadN-fadA-fadE operon] [hydrothermal vent metagenome]|uniref:3-hydroxyacyl-CoA dehydrogenase [fadN-fadA-fadE operon] / Enoyl-CoA hydratase [fadN-fadA-fadE operon] n=1 Tax=hydrothermal vent metagenome TaxID=652676 RepID=A0A3B0V9Z8_9ZZZZ